jgi:signal transduction histidine kinase
MHAGASATGTVQITYERQALAIDVSDEGRGVVSELAATGAGHGLIGMRERVEIYGGELSSGPRTGGGYVVRAVLPVMNDAAQVPEVPEVRMTEGAT